MRKKIVFTFLILLVAVNIALLFIVFNIGPKNGGPQKENVMTKELNFSEEQQERFYFLDQIHRNEMRQLDNELDGLRKELFNSFSKTNFSPDSTATRIGQLESLKQKELFAFFSEVRKLCDENQVAKFDSIIQKALRKRGPKPPRKEGRRKSPPPHRKDF